MVLKARFFSKESFSVTFSTTLDQEDQNLTFTFQEDKTILTGDESKVWNEISIFDFGKLNDFEIEFSNNSIEFKNHAKGSISVDGTFEQYNFIGFYSEKLTTWVVSESKIVES